MPVLNVGLAVILLLTLNQPLFLKSAIFKTQRPGDTLVDYNEEVDATVTTLKDDEAVYRLYVDTNQAAGVPRVGIRHRIASSHICRCYYIRVRNAHSSSGSVWGLPPTQ